MRISSLLTIFVMILVIGVTGCGTTNRISSSSLPQTTAPSNAFISVTSSAVTNDVVEGVAGAVEGNAVIKTYNLSAVVLPYSITASSNGSFSLNIGNQSAGFFFYISATAPGKAESTLYSYLYEVTQ